MKEFAKKFYLSKTWRDCRNAYKRSVGGLCERCIGKGLYVPGEIVHHKIHLTPDNMHDYQILLDWSNLELLCKNCHADVHKRIKKRYKIGRDGKVCCTPPLSKKNTHPGVPKTEQKKNKSREISES